MPNTEGKIKVLIVEDLRINQELLKALLAEDPDFSVIGMVSNGYEAVKFVALNRPDVVSMDINMPGMNGIEATREIMQKSPVPIVITSSLFSPDDGKMMMSILEAGALTLIPFPCAPGQEKYQQSAKNFRYTLKTMARVQVKSISRSRNQAELSKPTVQSEDKPSPGPVPGAAGPPARTSVYQIIAVGASAGGPQVIQYLLNNLPVSLPVPLLIVQHIDASFADGYYSWLCSTSKLPLHVARNGEKMQAGHAYLPPGDHHLGIMNQGYISVNQKPPEKGLRPAVSALFRDVRSFYGEHAIAVILSGMGSDGAAEMKTLHDCGAYTIAQDAQSSIVHGMPGEAIKMGGAKRILSPPDIVRDINSLLMR